MCGQNQSIRQEAKVFIDSLTTVLAPLNTRIEAAYWNATASGEEQFYDQMAQLEKERIQIYADQSIFRRIEYFRQQQQRLEPLLQRTIEVVYFEFQKNQADPDLLGELTELKSKTEYSFNTFRGKIDGQEVTGNYIREILKNSDDIQLRRKAWEASKQVGALVGTNIITMAHLRNKIAQTLGYRNFYEMQLITGEQSPTEIEQIFDELERNTREPYLKAKAEIDQFLAGRFKIATSELMPWHYSDPFFQEAPIITPVQLDPYYENQDVITLSHNYFRSIGIDVDPILKRSDLYERPKKYPHAYCTHIDREGDVRIMVNVVPNESWMSTVLHELGHAIYDVHLDMQLPYFLRQPAHSFTTEAVAIFFEKLSKNPEWMQHVLHIQPEALQPVRTAAAQALRFEKLIFARWSLVMLHFEKGLYENPEQDLNQLWWHLVEKYQMIKSPMDRHQPDWAAKIHICSYPVYYHNYQLGGLLAAQFLQSIATNGNQKVAEVRLYDDSRIGDFFIQKVFRPAARYRWDEMIEKATGRKLTSVDFVNQL